MINPTLSDLVGGIQAVTLSDEEARRRSTQKTVLERKSPPTFDIVVEIVERDRLAIHRNVGEVVDALLRGRQPRPEIRQRTDDGGVETVQTAATPQGGDSWADDAAPPNGRIRSLYPYGVSRNRLEKAVKTLGLTVDLTKTWQEADGILTLKAHYRKDSPKLREAMARNVPIFVVRSNTYVQIAGRLREIFSLPQPTEDTGEEDEPWGIREAEAAVRRVRETREPAELSPQNAMIRRLQHQLAHKNRLQSYSVGRDPNRRVRILPE
jgi:hypothetical protein